MNDHPQTSDSIGVIAIGRNEGDRLVACLNSVIGKAAHVVYVDSGSTDGSVEFARSVGVDVVELDTSTPFTAAKARNAGFRRLMERADVTYVQFVDGDCQVVDGWLRDGKRVLDENPDVAATGGRRRERYPSSSVYNLLCDMEWDTPVGDTRSIGGDSMMRVTAYDQVGGFDDGMIAGEEPELCMRLLKSGWRIIRVDREMTLHDAAMTRFSQWWRRMERAGHAYADGAARHGAPPWHHNIREMASIMFWVLALPVGVMSFAAMGSKVTPLAWWLLAALPGAYLVLFVRIYRHRRRHGDDPHRSRLYAVFTTLAKLPLFQGAASYWINRLRQRPRGLIEYK